MLGKILLFALGSVFLHSSLGFNLEVTFTDSSYVTYTLPRPQRTTKDVIGLLFRTIKPSGLLLHVAGKHDFLTLELLRGRLRYTSNLGGPSSGSAAYDEFLIGENLADNEWHQVDIKRTGMTLKMELDVETKLFNISGKYSSLDIEGRVYVAGGDDDVKRKLRRHSDYEFESFQGCLFEVCFNGINILEMAHERNASTTIYGSITYNCKEEAHYNPVTFPNPHAYVKVRIRELNATDFNFKFRTYEGNGLLLHQRFGKSNGAEVSIRLESGRISSKVVFYNPRTDVTQQVGQNLADGLWHSVSLYIDHRRVRLTVDGDPSENHQDIESFSCAGEVTVGASETGLTGFVGCMYDLVIQGKRVNISNEQRTQVLLDKCRLEDHCLPSPCMNKGRCIQELNNTKCDCEGTDYSGEKCNVLAFTSANCAELWAAGKRDKDYYKINPSGTKPFVVLCGMSEEGDPMTIVENKGTSNITASDGHITRGFYEHSVSYNIELDVIEAIVKSSTRCRQLIRYYCYNSVLLDSANQFNYSGRGARWRSRSGQIQDYWGGAPPGSRSCACGESRTCSQPDLKCNCDTADKEWRSDEGFITNKNDLPVTSLRFSVDGTNPHSVYRLGNLECFGTTKSFTPTAHATTKSPTSDTAITSIRSTPMLTKPTRKNTAPRLPTTIKTIDPAASEMTETPSSKTTLTTTSKDVNSGPIVIIETPRKYITIRETGHQQLVTIVLSIVLVVFICAILVLLARQNLLCPCKCLQMPAYQDVNNIELGPSAPLYNQNNQSEIVKYETSPYHSKGEYEITMVLRSGETLTRWSPDMDSDAETDRLDISNGNSSDNSETSTGFPKQNDAPEKVGEHEAFPPAELDLGTGGLTIMDAYSLSFGKVVGGRMQKPSIHQNDHAKTYTPFSRGPNVQQERRMSFSDDDESIVDTITSVSDQNNSFGSITSINTRSWSDDGSMYLSDSIRRQNTTIEKTRGSYGDSNEYLSREDQFVEISPHSAERCPWVKNDKTYGQKGNVGSVNVWNPSNTIVPRAKVDTDQKETSFGVEEYKVSMDSRPQNRQNSKARRLNVNHEPDNSWNNLDEKNNFADNPASSFPRPGKNGQVLLMELKKRDHRRQVLSDDKEVSENSETIRRHETEL